MTLKPLCPPAPFEHYRQLLTIFSKAVYFVLLSELPLVQRWPTFWFPTFSRSMASPRILFLTMVHSSPRSGRPSVKLWCNSQFIIRLPSSDEWSDRPIRMWNLHNAARHPPPGALTSRGLNMPINPSSALPHLSLPPSVFNQRYFPVKEEEFNVLTEKVQLFPVPHFKIITLQTGLLLPPINLGRR